MGCKNFNKVEDIVDINLGAFLHTFGLKLAGILVNNRVMELLAGKKPVGNHLVGSLACVHFVTEGLSVRVLCCVDIIKDCVKTERVKERNKNIFIAVVTLNVETAVKELEADVSSEHCKSGSKRSEHLPNAVDEVVLLCGEDVLGLILYAFGGGD